MPRSVKSPVKQKSCRSDRHGAHDRCEHGRRTEGTTRSPGLNSDALDPASTTSPSASWPSTRNSEPSGGVPYSKLQISRSVPQMPTSIVRTFTCLGAEISGAGCETRRTARLSGITPTARIFPFFIYASYVASLLLHVVTKEHVLIAKVELSADDDRMRPAILPASLRLFEPALLDKSLRRGFN